MFVTHLSTDLHLDIASFLDDNDKVVFGSCCVRFYKDLLLNHLRRLKRSTSNFLNEYESNEETREKFTKYIHFPERQVHISVPMTDNAISFPFRRLYYLFVEMKLQQHYLQQIEKIHTLDLSIDSTQEYAELLFLPERLGIKHLYISIYGDGVLSALPVMPSCSLEILTLNGPCLTLPTNFYGVISQLHELNLSSLDCVSDVSMFVNIKKISFCCCHNIIDIKPLQTIADVTIEDCRGIIDYRNALTYSHHISIKATQVEAVIDVSCFKAVKTLKVTVSDKTTVLGSLAKTSSFSLKRLTIGGNLHRLFTDFNYLQELTVTGVPLLSKVDMFGCIPVLRLFALKNVESLDGLGYDEDISNRLRNRSVTISRLGKVQDFTPLNTIPFVDIINCVGLCDLSQVKDVKKLIIRYCHNILEPSVPLNNENITLAGDIPDNLLLHLTNVKELDVSLVEIDDLSGLETSKNLERIVLPNDWNEQETAGWEMLKQDYLKFEYDRDATIYVKKVR